MVTDRIAALHFQRHYEPVALYSGSLTFDFTVATTGADETVTIPCQNVGTFSATMTAVDADAPHDTGATITAYNDADLVMTFASAGDHEVSISGTFPNIHFNNGGDKAKLKAVASLGAVGWTRFDEAFYGCTNLITFVAGGGANTSSVTLMTNMFRGCTGLLIPNVGGMDTSIVTSMSNVFDGCTGMTSLDLSNWDVTSGTNFSSFVLNCSAMTSIDLTGFVPSASTTFNGMFNGCGALTSLDCSSFDVDLATDFTNMFLNCDALTTLDVSSFTTAIATNFGSMFKNVDSVTALDVSNFTTTAVTNFNQMFNLCNAVTSLDVSSWNTAASTNFNGMFNACNALTSIVGMDGWNIEGLDGVGDLGSFITTGKMTTAQYDAVLVAWDGQNPFDSMTPNFGASTYTDPSAAATARANLISTDLWTITDGGTA